MKELEADGLVYRKAMQVVPPHVIYSLTPASQELVPVLKEWPNGDLNIAVE